MGKVRLLSNLIRWVAVLWIFWAAAQTLGFWGNREALVQGYGHALGTDLSHLPQSHHILAIAVVLADLALAFTLAWQIWQLFGIYARGEIFTAKSVEGLSRIGCVGVAAVAADLVLRPLLSAIVTMHLADGPRLTPHLAQPNDLLHLMMALFIVALAYIFKTGVELADDNRQIV